MKASLFYYLKKSFTKHIDKSILCFFFFYCFFSYKAFGQNDCIEGYAEITVDTLNGIYGFTLNGIDPLDYSGEGVNSAGDFNNDGFDDIIIGASSVNNNEGEAYVIYGATNMTDPFELSSLNSNNGFIINATGTDEYESFGRFVSTAGDFNNDGFDDIIIGAVETNYGAGAAYIIYGQNNINSPFDVNTINGNNGFVVYGMDDSASLGKWVNMAGDFNNDGFDDIIIGAHTTDPNLLNRAGESYIIFGTNNIISPFDLSTLNGSNGFKVSGLDANDYSGESVSSAGDVNNDGFDDVIIGARRADPNGIDSAGECYVIYGRTNISSSFDLSTLNGSNGFVINGINEGDNAGQTVSNAGDINNDGFDDLIIASRYHTEAYVVYGGNNISSPFELNSLNGNNGFAIDGVQGFAGLLNLVSGAGDVNNDGFDDLIIDGLDKICTIYGGSNISHPFYLSDINGSNGFVIDSIAGSVGGTRDINNDGYDDLIIGNTNADPNGIVNAGETYIIYGNCGCNIEASIINLPSSTLDLSPISLTAIPLGGQFMGNGIVFNAFNPSIAGPGIHTITYHYTNSNGCEAVASSNILVATVTYNFVNYNLGVIPP